MAIKAFQDIVQPDPRFVESWIAEGGRFRKITLADHYAAVSSICPSVAIPTDVEKAFDRARNVIIYAFFDYDLLVVGETQALGAFELALKHRLNGHGGEVKGTLHNLVQKARKAGILPELPPNSSALSDPIESLIKIRNRLSHGTSDIHTLGMALEIIATCASWIDHIFRL